MSEPPAASRSALAESLSARPPGMGGRSTPDNAIDSRFLVSEALNTLRLIDEGRFDVGMVDVEVLDVLSRGDERASTMARVLREWIAIKRRAAIEAAADTDSEADANDNAAVEEAAVGDVASHANRNKHAAIHGAAIHEPVERNSPTEKTPAPSDARSAVSRLALFGDESRAFLLATPEHDAYAGDPTVRHRLVAYLKTAGLDAYARGDLRGALTLWGQASRLAPSDREIAKFLKRAKRTTGN